MDLIGLGLSVGSRSSITLMPEGASQMTRIIQPNRDISASREGPLTFIGLPRGRVLTTDASASAEPAYGRPEQTVDAQDRLNDGSALSARKPIRVLIVEDDGMVAWLIGETIKGMGHEVCGITGCEEDAVAMSARERPDLLLVDAHLDVGSGVGAVRRILLHGPVPHIFMSGDALCVESLGPNALVLRKPFQDVDLEQAIHQAFAAKPTE
jgi:CheY-like chemotaxis protein